MRINRGMGARRLRFLVICISILACHSLAADPVRLGLENHTWTSLFGGEGTADQLKRDFYLANLDQYSALGATWNVVRIDQTVDGPDGFKRLNAILAAHEKRHIDVVLRLIEDPQTYGRLRDAKDDAAFGYDQKYFDWVANVTRYVAHRVHVMLIGNETDKDISVNLPRERRSGPLYVEYEAYRRLLATGYRAIKSIDPSIQVGDHGVESYSLLSAVIDDMIDSGDKAGAIALCQSAFWGRVEYEGECQAFPRRLALDGQLRARVEKARRSFEEPGPADFHQLHLYMSSDALPPVLSWISAMQRKNGSSRPLMATEVGYLIPARRTGIAGRGRRVADREKYSQMHHAEELFKTITTLAGNGVPMVEVWEMRAFAENDAPVATLFKNTNEPHELVPYKAAVAFGVLARTLRNAESIKTESRCGNTCIEYSFATPAGNVTILWGRDSSPEVTGVEIENGEEVEDIFGGEIDSSTRRVVLGPSPIIVSRFAKK